MPVGVPTRSGQHQCWIYDEPGEFRARVRAFLSEGLDRGERVWYAGEGSEKQLLDQFPGFDDAIERGAARVLTVDAVYPSSLDDPQRQIDAFAGVLHESLASGFTGMRVAADATGLVTGESWNRYEHLVDRFMVGRPIVGLCGFDRHRLDPETIAQLECLHPVSNTNSAGFRLHACSPDPDRVALAGELDISTHDLLLRALDAADLEPAGGEMVVEARDVVFIDHRSIALLARYAANRSATLVLRDPSAGAERLVHLLNPSNIRVEWSA